MSDQPLPTQASSTNGLVAGAAMIPDVPLEAGPKGLGSKKSKKKLRSAWISFVSRIIAQFVGSAATIVLGLMFLQKYHNTTADTAPRTTALSRSTGAVMPPVRARIESGAVALAVLPLENFSGDPAQDHVANAMTEALITELSQVNGLRVISRTSSMRYRGVGKALPEIARELAVDWIVEGSMVTGGGRVRFTSQLIDASKDEHVWAASYEREVQDSLSLQSGLASAIAGDVDRALNRQKERDAARTRATVPAGPPAMPPVESAEIVAGTSGRQ
jgi:TolB-like protein